MRKTPLTPAQVSMLEEMRQTLHADIDDARAKLAVVVLLGQGWTCYSPDAQMALTRDASDHYRFTPVHGHLGGVLHLTERDARALADHWNNGLKPKDLDDATRQRLAVRPMHQRELLQTVIRKAEELLAFLDQRS